MKNIILSLITLFGISASVQAQDPDMSLIPYRAGNLWGYADPQKNIVIKPAYEEAEFFYEGYAVVKKNNKYGYINKAGKVLIPFKFYSAGHFKFGYFESQDKEKTADGLNQQKLVLFAGASLKSDGYEVCIDTKGNWMGKCPAIDESSAMDVNKPSSISFEKTYNTLSRSDLYDKIIDDYKIAGNDETYYIAEKNGLYGVFNNKFEVVMPFGYAKIQKWDIDNGVFIQVEKDGKHGLLTVEGNASVPVQYNSMRRVRTKEGKNYFIASQDGRYSILDATNKNKLQETYSNIAYDEAGGFVLTDDRGLKGFYFPDSYVVQPKYADIMAMKEGNLVKVKTAAGKSGYINSNGVEFFVE